MAGVSINKRVKGLMMVKDWDRVTVYMRVRVMNRLWLR